MSSTRFVAASSASAAIRLGLREAFGDRFVAARKLAKLLHAQLKLARSLVMFVGDEKRGHQKKPLIAHLADRAQEFSDLVVDMLGELAQMVLLAVIAGDGVGAPVHHDIHERHEILLAAERDADLADRAVEPSFHFLRDFGKRTIFFFQFGDARQKLLALRDQFGRPGLRLGKFGAQSGERRNGLLQCLKYLIEALCGDVEPAHTRLIPAVRQDLRLRRESGSTHNLARVLHGYFLSQQRILVMVCEGVTKRP